MSAAQGHRLYQRTLPYLAPAAPLPMRCSSHPSKGAKGPYPPRELVHPNPADLMAQITVARKHAAPAVWNSAGSRRGHSGECPSALPCGRQPRPTPSSVPVQAGSFIFKGRFPPQSYLELLDFSTDADLELPDTAGEPVPPAKKALLQDLSPWLVDPGYQRVSRRWGCMGWGDGRCRACLTGPQAAIPGLQAIWCPLAGPM